MHTHIVHHGGYAMKYIFMMICSLLCLCGCQNTLGSFEDGSLNPQELIFRINHQAEEQNWNITMLKESEDIEALSRYGLSEQDIVKGSVYHSVIDAIPNEIAIFEVNEEQKEAVREKVHSYIEERKQDTSLLSAYKGVLDSYKEVEIGNYYIVVIMEDADKIIQFLQECS